MCGFSRIFCAWGDLDRRLNDHFNDSLEPIAEREIHADVENQLSHCFDANHIEIYPEKSDLGRIGQSARVRVKGSDREHFHVEQHEGAVEREVSVAKCQHDDGEEHRYKQVKAMEMLVVSHVERRAKFPYIASTRISIKDE